MAKWQQQKNVGFVFQIGFCNKIVNPRNESNDIRLGND